MTWKSKFARFLAIFGGISLLLFAGLWYLDENFSGPGLLGGCGGKVYSSATSPDKQLMAYSFERDCGATTDFATFVVIRAKDDKLDLGAALVDSEIVFQSEGDYKPKVKWLSNGQLAIAFPPEAPTAKEIWQKDAVHQQISISYQGL